MNKSLFFSLMSFFIGIICFILAFIESDLEVGFIVILPFLMGSGSWSVLGFVFFFFSFLFYSMKPMDAHRLDDKYVDETRYNERSVSKGSIQKIKVKISGLIMIGPIPILFGKDNSRYYSSFFLFIGYSTILLTTFNI